MASSTSTSPLDPALWNNRVGDSIADDISCVFERVFVALFCSISSSSEGLGKCIEGLRLGGRPRLLGGGGVDLTCSRSAGDNPPDPLADDSSCAFELVFAGSLPATSVLAC